MNKDGKYKFSWDLIGDIENGRPNLGNMTRVEVYRLMQFSFRDVIEKHVGSEKADQIFYESGRLAGQEFYKNMMTVTDDFNEFINELQTLLRDLGVGILRVENIDLENKEITLTVSEDLDCSGLPELDFETCIYDEGFIASLLECFSGTDYTVKEIDCWCTGDRTCRFKASAKK